MRSEKCWGGFNLKHKIKALPEEIGRAFESKQTNAHTFKQ